MYVCTHGNFMNKTNMGIILIQGDLRIYITTSLEELVINNQG